jgi:hypothetical protein
MTTEFEGRIGRTCAASVGYRPVHPPIRHQIGRPVPSGIFAQVSCLSSAVTVKLAVSGGTIRSGVQLYRLIRRNCRLLTRDADIACRRGGRETGAVWSFGGVGRPAPNSTEQGTRHPGLTKNEERALNNI